MERLPPWYPTILHGFSVVAVPVCMLAVAAWEHPFTLMLLMPMALVAAMVHLVAAIASARAQTKGLVSPTAHTISKGTTTAAVVGFSLALAWFDHLSVPWWAAAAVVALAHLAFVLEPPAVLPTDRVPR